MHLSIRYGAKGKTPINHLEESIKEGRVSSRGLGSQGWIHNRLSEFIIKNPDHEPITVDLRASNDQIIALGTIDPKTRQVQDGFWSNDKAYRSYWDVEWRRVFPIPLTKKKFEEKFAIEDGVLKDQFFYAHHAWMSPDLNLSGVSKQNCDTWLIGALDVMIENQEEGQKYIDDHLSQAFTIEDHRELRALSDRRTAIMNSAKDRSYCEVAEIQWKEHVEVKKTKKPKKSSAERKRRAVEKKFVKIYHEAITSGIQGDYAMATYFTNKRSLTPRHKRNWSGKTVKSLRIKLIQ